MPVLNPNPVRLVCMLEIPSLSNYPVPISGLGREHIEDPGTYTLRLDARSRNILPRCDQMIVTDADILQDEPPAPSPEKATTIPVISTSTPKPQPPITNTAEQLCLLT